MVASISLNEEEDIFMWSLRKKGSFLVISFYKDIVATNNVTEKMLSGKQRFGYKLKFCCGT